MSPLNLPRSPALDASTAQLHSERDALASLASDIEGDFVRLGDLLGDTSAACSRLAGLADDLRRVARGEDGKRALVFSYELFKKYSDLVLAGIDQAERVRQELGAVSADVAILAKRERDFSEIVTSFWLLKTAFRVEAASLSHEHRALLLGLTNGMDELHEGLKRLVFEQFGRLAATRLQIARLDARLGDVQTDSRRRVQQARRQLESDLDAFTNALSPATRFSEQVTNESARAGLHVSQVIVSLQYHDIVRQRVEHVVTAIDEILTTLAAAGSDGANLADEAASVEVASAGARVHFSARIQLEQLRDARSEIDGAGETIVCGIREVLESGEAVLGAGMRLRQLVTDGLRRSQASSSFVNKIQDLHDSQGAVAHDVDALVKLASDVGTIVEDLSVDVVQKTQALRLVALNAGVQALHVSAGGALEQLAAITQRDADEALAHTKALLAGARSIHVAVEGLRGGLEEFLELTRDEDAALDGEALMARQLLVEMRSGVAASFEGLDGDFDRLRKAAHRTLDELTFREVITTRFTKMEAALEGVVAATAGLVDRESESYELSLASLRASYTMERERAMHDAVARREHERRGATAVHGSSGTSLAGADAASAPALDENVELF